MSIYCIIARPNRGTTYKSPLLWLAPYSYVPPVLNVLYLGLDKTGIAEQQTGVIKQKIPFIMIHPNPFRETTAIKYQLTYGMNVQNSIYTVKIFNISGQLTREFSISNNSGYRDIIWDGTDEFGNQVPAGVYFVRLKTAHHSAVQKVIFVK